MRSTTSYLAKSIRRGMFGGLSRSYTFVNKVKIDEAEARIPVYSTTVFQGRFCTHFQDSTMG